MSEERPSPAELYRRAEALIPVLQSRAALCEELRCCPPETIDELEQAGLLRRASCSSRSERVFHHFRPL